MKNENKTTKNVRNLDSLLAKLTENELLNEEQLIFIRGGEGDNGGNPIIPPPPPKP
jgi:hypothetical protein